VGIVMGVRYDLTRKTHAAPFRYEGTATLESGVREIVAHIDATGAVSVEDLGDEGLQERVRLFLRSVWKDSEGDPPAFVRRWRENR
jgi:hypothetical protein